MLRVFLLCCILLPSFVQAELSNTLKGNASPYLAMHGNDPVNWQQWTSETVDQARKENKLLFVSIGYFACHWCHVMQKESYQANDIAMVLNDKFIPVKVDRELHPALDARLIEFVNRTRGYSGWPLNVFITPEGYPLLGLVYLPHDDFKALVEKLATFWAEDAEGLKNDARLAAAELEPEEIDQSNTTLSEASNTLGKDFVRKAMIEADKFLGGFGEQSKFPSVPKLDALLDQYKIEAKPELGKFLVTTLNSMQKYGLNDSLGGGFFRYTVDPQWRVPHFEKMLYDNALLANLYFKAARVLRHPEYKATAVATTRFMSEVMGRPNGGLVASLSAVDDKNVEGGYYLWDRDEIKQLLNHKEWAVVEPAWGLNATPTLEGKYLPVAEGPLDELQKEKTVRAAGIAQKEIGKLLASARKKLRDVRNKRGLPVDTKQLAGWNGLALSAFVNTAQTTKDKKDVEAAQRLRDFIVNERWDGRQLLRAKDKQGKVIGKATIEDYAYVSAGLLDWAHYTGKPKDLALAMQVTDQAWQRFFTTHGWQLSEENLLGYGMSEHALSDGPMPSPAATILHTTQSILASKPDAALSINNFKLALAASEPLVVEDPYWFSSYVAVIQAAKK